MNEIQELFNFKRNEDGTVAVSGRELHKGLQIETQYSIWVKRMIGYGFEENIDYIEVNQKRLTSHGREHNQLDHIMTLDMAKEISMIQRSEIGREIRGYFIKVERQHNQLASAYGITSLDDMNQLIEQLVSDKLDYLISTGQVNNKKLDELNNKFEGEYVTPQDIDAIKFAIKSKAEQILGKAGIQVTIDEFLVGDVYEQALANKKAKEEYRHQLGKVKSKLLVKTKKHLGMKGNAPNNHIKRKDVDLAIQFIKDVRPSAIEI
ncbi:antA/AntB antirepressor family protein [Staphylococcus chromogenes]|uniref:antA/AntB antirepressor family protein n=1 Tax=Staphylococcus chromogenes TaxID=46126 RepID=UPI000D19C1F3|nr:antA/AntB antirepressor family protein [Staphylococcus chromogenes]MCE4971685.1 antA/AntB antirepressor family protein [Staphylococcus chromogenes]PTF57658.1 phage antirepressor Ant [Staphylococcus chromogenes]PTF76501.1 phage antirepressor Ant [Staphylococcus chromogenes]PTF93490.1 phage antirepressor Ant [Staphylococcus chromogenes]PUZ11923.1 phage antirepressor Ant [Staphylococcus chromogenes]